jgi:hypothetical protein
LSHTQDNKEELRTDAEQNVAKFIEVAKQMETFFLQRRLQISVLKPEQLIKEVMSLFRNNYENTHLAILLNRIALSSNKN